jgi:Tfp pilus assembly protein PilX
MKSFESTNQKGMALPLVLIFLMIATWVGATLLQTLSVHGGIVQDDYNYTRALYLAESGLNRAAEAMWIGFLNSSAQPVGRADWLDEHYADFDQVAVPLGEGDDLYSVEAKRVMLTGQDDARYIVFEATGKAAGSHVGSGEEDTERTVTRVIRYGNDQSSIFDYVYFINNFGWFWGGTIDANGDVRANANFSFKYNPMVNGDAYASVNADVGADGSVIDGGYHSWDLSTYRNNAEDHWRPTFPEFQYGYDGSSETFEHQDVLEMPYLEDTERFEDLAEFRNGTLSTADVNITHTTDGPIFLFGTPENPIQLDGPVVVRGDVVIAGYVEGQGTIYTERNVHIVGDLIYTNPPDWDHSEGADPETSGPSGDEDFLGIAAQGNVILGDYTNSSDWYNNVKNYLKPPFTTPYTDQDGSTHSGDYTQVDGAKLDGTQRRSYESTFSNAEFQAMVQMAMALFGHDHKPRQIDALTYTNHLFGGRVNSCNFNGAIMSRDEAIVYSNWVNLNYDYRAKAEGENYIDIDLPRSANARPVIWLEGPYEQWVSKLDAIDTGLEPGE